MKATVPGPVKRAMLVPVKETYSELHKQLAEQDEVTEEDLDRELEEAKKAQAAPGRSLARSFGFRSRPTRETAEETHEFHDQQVALQLAAANSKQQEAAAPATLLVEGQ